jgi:hypothetical protein
MSICYVEYSLLYKKEIVIHKRKTLRGSGVSFSNLSIHKAYYARFADFRFAVFLADFFATFFFEVFFAAFFFAAIKIFLLYK